EAPRTSRVPHTRPRRGRLLEFGQRCRRAVDHYSQRRRLLLLRRLVLRRRLRYEYQRRRYGDVAMGGKRATYRHAMRSYIYDVPATRRVRLRHDDERDVLADVQHAGIV